MEMFIGLCVKVVETFCFLNYTKVHILDSVNVVSNILVTKELLESLSDDVLIIDINLEINQHWALVVGSKSEQNKPTP